MTRVRLAMLLALSALLLAGCGTAESNQQYTDPAGVLGISGAGWFWIIIAAIGGICWAAASIWGKD